jgi:predicted alpha-1,6-mannanase (GH76 family)
VIVEKLGTTGDASLFKGVYARYLAHLRDVLTATKQEPAIAQKIDHHIRVSADSLLQHFPKPEEPFGADWSGDVQDPSRNFNTQTSALTALVAILPEPAPTSRVSGR